MRNMRKIMMTLLLFVAMAANAVNITYSLTTHIDGRTITGSASVNSVDEITNKMPRALWRAYCTYKYYSDEAMTQEISVLPEEGATVYVDYVFEPPFFVSSEGVEYYYYFNAYIASTKYFLCDDLGAVKHNAPASDRAHALWALYGDGYCINLKAKQTGKWLTYNTSAPVIADAPMTTGWQLYESSFTNNGRVHGTVVLGTTNNDNQILHYDNNATPPSTPGINHSMGRFVLENITNTGWNNIAWDNHHKLHNTASNYSTNMLSNSSFFFTVGTYENIYSTVWRILQADGTWLPDIITQKGSSQVAIGMPPSGRFKEKDHCTYDRYYKDSEFSEKYPDDYMIPVTGNTVIYIKETYKNGQPFVTDHWVTIALSYKVDDLAKEWGYAADGVTPAVRFLEYYDVTTNKENTKYDLKFRRVDKIEAHKPYLFKADEVLKGKNINLSKDANWNSKTEEELIGFVEGKKVQYKDVANNSPYVTFIATYLDKELTVQSEHPELLYFYFGYDKRYDKENEEYVGDDEAAGKYPYNFYRVTKKSVNIPKHRCYFYIKDEKTLPQLTFTALNFIEDVNGVSDQIYVEPSFSQSQGIYNINGQLISTNAENTEGLSKGLYIINGKKVVIR